MSELWIIENFNSNTLQILQEREETIIHNIHYPCRDNDFATGIVIGSRHRGAET